MHDQCVQSVLYSPLGVTESTPVGSFMNRFSRDFDVVDSLLMESIRQPLVQMCTMGATFIIIAVVTPFFLIGMVPVVVLYRKLQQHFTRANVALRRMEATRRSPVLAFITDSMHGLSTLRAYVLQGAAKQQLAELIDVHSSVIYSINYAQLWLGGGIAVLSSIVCLLSALLALGQNVSSSAAGVSISQALTIVASLSTFMRLALDCETNLVSVELRQSDLDTTREPPHRLDGDEGLQQRQWPEQGELEFKQVCLRYRPELPLALDHLNIRLLSGQRLGIVGRTGAGQSPRRSS
jgi:ABC-type multidrug transport system fused ATPase/permease subunit